MLEIIKSYLNKEEYYIIIYSNFIYVYKYIDILKFTDSFISLKLDKFKINISGSDLLITKLEKRELLIKGNIIKIERVYE